MIEPVEPPRKEAAPSVESGGVPVVPDHEVIRMIGSGAAGQVWLAKSTLGTFRAVKVVWQRSFKHRQPFERELHGILKFEPVSRSHDGLVDILQVGRNDKLGYFYYVMELADDVANGRNISPETYTPRTLDQQLQQTKRLPIAECVRLTAGLASALGFLHRKGLFHRDIKPSNIIFVNGLPKLADIGLLTDTFEPGSFVGTVGFIPPEGCGTVRADIYSLGKVLYEMSTGKDRNEYPALPDDLEENPEGYELVALNRIILKACRKQPWYRYHTAEEMMSALLRFQFDKRSLRRRAYMGTIIRWAAVVGILVALGVMGAGIWRIVWLLQNTQ